MAVMSLWFSEEIDPLTGKYTGYVHHASGNRTFHPSLEGKEAMASLSDDFPIQTQRMTVQEFKAAHGLPEVVSTPAEQRHGHPRFYQLTRDEEGLHSRKNSDYAQGGDALGNFKRVAALLAMYPDLDMSNPAVVALVYSLKQLDAALWLLNIGHQAKVEGIPERLGDVSIYAKLARIMVEERN